MNIIYADYNIYHNSIDICTYAGYRVFPYYFKYHLTIPNLLGMIVIYFLIIKIT